jgi:RNA polymerase sigma factor (sigma-70 family)
MIPEISKSEAFRTTHWTQVLEAADPEQSDLDAFASLYRAYWSPLYAYTRRRGFAPAEAEDVTQAFFTRLISKQSLVGLQREGGRFRSFLLKTLQHFLADEWDRAHAQKRGGGSKPLSLDSASGEACWEALGVASEATPETVFERQWASALLDQVHARLELEETKAGRDALFRDLRPHLQNDGNGLSYAEIARRQFTSEGAVKVAVHRLRQRFGQYLRDEIARTVSSPAEVDEELRYLIEVARR